MKGTYPVANRLTNEAATSEGRAYCSPDRNESVRDVATDHSVERQMREGRNHK